MRPIVSLNRRVPFVHFIVFELCRNLFVPPVRLDEFLHEVLQIVFASPADDGTKHRTSS